MKRAIQYWSRRSFVGIAFKIEIGMNSLRSQFFAPYENVALLRWQHCCAAQRETINERRDRVAERARVHSKYVMLIGELVRKSINCISFIKNVCYVLSVAMLRIVLVWWDLWSVAWQQQQQRCVYDKFNCDSFYKFSAGKEIEGWNNMNELNLRQYECLNGAFESHTVHTIYLHTIANARKFYIKEQAKPNRHWQAFGERNRKIFGYVLFLYV